MGALFPFGFAAPTAWYLTLYAVALAVHVIFMNYVLAGTAYLAVVTVFTGGPDRQRQRAPMALVLRDWMPFFVSAAITAGVAPLLFIQIVYQKPFYTANLLLFHRWMSILPVLIVGFYLLYLMKSRRIGEWSLAARIVVGPGSFLCFAFTGYSWAENHLLAMDEKSWPTFYGTGAMLYRSTLILPRFGVWFFGAMSVMCTWVAWQLRHYCRSDARTLARELRRCAALSVTGLLLAAVCAVLYYRMLDATPRSAVTSSLARPYLVLGILAAAAQFGAWLTLFRSPAQSLTHLRIASASAVITILCATVVRESIRLSVMDMTRLAEAHVKAAGVGGLSVFAICTLLNAGVIVWCILLVRRDLRAPSWRG